MDSFFPAQTLFLFRVFAPCFTAPSFAYFQSHRDTRPTSRFEKSHWY
jgi:hypothetical protein